MELIELEQKFQELLSHPILSIEEPLPTLFDISGFPHYENVSSNIYAFFLDPSNPHGLGDLFIMSLANLISTKVQKEKERDFFVEECTVIREFDADKGFIDLVIHDGSSVETCSTAIVLENKIKHHVHNDLDDYYDSVRIPNDSVKIGVLLTLNKVNQKLSALTSREYVNITHLEWVSEIKNNLGAYLTQANEKYLILLKDFIENFENMSNTVEPSDHVHFAFKHGKKLEELLELKKSATAYLTESLYRASLSNEIPWTWHRLNQTSVSLSRLESALWSYIYFDQVYGIKELKIEIWYRGSEAVEKWKIVSLDELAKRFPDLNIGHQRFDNKEWVRIGYKSYKDLKKEQVEDFGGNLMNMLMDDFEEFCEEAEKLIQQKF